MTGYNNLDLLLGGMQRSDMIILGARPSLGKSALAVNMSLNVAQNGGVVGIFSLEMSREQLALRILSADAEIDAHRLRLNLTNDAEEQRITDSIGRLSELPVFVDDTPFQGMVEMRSKARRLSLEQGLDLVVLDYMQLVQGKGRGDNRVQEMSEISRSVKGMARELPRSGVRCRCSAHHPAADRQLQQLRQAVDRAAHSSIGRHRGTAGALHHRKRLGVHADARPRGTGRHRGEHRHSLHRIRRRVDPATCPRRPWRGCPR